MELVGAKPLHLLTQTVPSLKSPTGAFIASQTLIFQRKKIIRTHLLSETSSDYFCLVLLKNSRNDFLLRYTDDAIGIQSEFWNDRKADEGEGHKDADIFRYTMCLEGIVQRLHFRRNALCAFGAHQSGHRKRKFCHDLSICHKRKSAFVFPHGIAGQHHIGIVVPCHNQVSPTCYSNCC